MNIYFIQLDNKNKIVALITQEQELDDGWIRVETMQELDLGMVKLSDGSFDNSENLWSMIREKRNALLAETDWTQLPDVVANRLTLAQVEAFAEYRQALADIPQNFEDPNDVVFPAHPLET